MDEKKQAIKEFVFMSVGSESDKKKIVQCVLKISRLKFYVFCAGKLEGK